MPVDVDLAAARRALAETAPNVDGRAFLLTAAGAASSSFPPIGWSGLKDYLDTLTRPGARRPAELELRATALAPAVRAAQELRRRRFPREAASGVAALTLLEVQLLGGTFLGGEAAGPTVVQAPVTRIDGVRITFPSSLLGDDAQTSDPDGDRGPLGPDEPGPGGVLGFVGHTDVDVHLPLPADWGATVAAAGLALVDGLFVLAVTGTGSDGRPVEVLVADLADAGGEDAPVVAQARRLVWVGSHPRLLTSAAPKP